jgi:hypothetical protein
MKRPRWTPLFKIAKAYADGQGDALLSAKFELSYASRLRTGPYESACWGALLDIKQGEQSAFVKRLVSAGPLRVLPDSSVEIDLNNTTLRGLIPASILAPAHSYLQKPHLPGEKQG